MISVNGNRSCKESIRVIQINLNHCRAATALAAKFAVEQKADIMLIQDPYCYEDRLYSFPSAWIQLPSADKKAWVCVLDTSMIFAPQPRLPTSIFVHVALSQGELLLGTQYAAPKDNLEENIAEWEHKLAGQQKQPVIVGGDLNARSEIWGYNHEDQRGKRLIEFITLNDLVIVNERDSPPTFEARGAVGWPDLTLTNREGFHTIRNWKVHEEDSLSDHHYISYEISLTPQRQIRRRYKTNYTNGNNFKRLFAGRANCLLTTLESVQNAPGLDAFTVELQSQIIGVANKTLGKKSVTKKPELRWWSPQLRMERNKLTALRKKCKKAEGEELPKLKLLVKKQKAVYTRLILENKQATWRDFCTASTAPYGAAYRYAHGKAFTPHQLQVDWGKRTLDKRESMKLLAQYLFPQEKSEEHTTYTTPIFTGTPDPPINSHEVHTAIHQLNVNKAPGPDSIDMRMIRWVHEISDILVKWVQKCYELSYFPKPLRTGEVVFFLKRGKNETEPGSYRPICLLPTLAKVLEKTVQRRLMHFLETNNKISEMQHGFRPGRSCETALNQLLERLRIKREDGLHTAVIALDIKGAFDCVKWSTIKDRLVQIGCPPKIGGLLHSYLENRSVQIFWGTGQEQYELTMGCPQGSCLGPILWLIVAETFLQTVQIPENCMVQAYADDFVMTISDSTRRPLEEKGNFLLQQFSQWLDSQGLQASTDKTTLTVVPRKGMRLMKRTPVLKLNGRSLRATLTFKYLGVTIAHNLTWAAHLQTLAVKAHQFNQGLHKVARGSWGVRTPMLKLWYLTVIEKSITYAAGCWGGHITKQSERKLDSIQRLFLLRLARAERTVSTAALQVLTGIPPLSLVVQKEHLLAQILRLHRNVNQNGRTYSHKDFQKRTTRLEQHPCEQETTGCFHQDNNVPETNITIYTDGSKLDGRVGAAYAVYCGEQEIAFHQERLRDEGSVFQAELLAIQEALMWIKSQCTDKKVSIKSDSRSVIQSLTSIKLNDPEVLKVTTELRKLKAHGIQVSISWVKAHVGLKGNERADRLAKEATKLTDITSRMLIPPSYLKNEAESNLQDLWQERWDTLSTGRTAHSYLPRVSRKLQIGAPWLTAFLSGHGPFQAHRARFNPNITGNCVCGEWGDATHYLFHCSLTNKWHIPPSTDANKKLWCQKFVSNKYWSRKMMSMWMWLKDNLTQLELP